MASAQKLLMISDTVFLDHRQAQRAAYLGMIDYIAEQSGSAPALIAQALQHSSSATALTNAGPQEPDGAEAGSFYETAKSAVAAYVAKRSETTRPPEGLAEALATMRRNLKMRGDGSGDIMVGVSALPPAALEKFAGNSELRQGLDHVYSLGRSPVEENNPAEPNGDGWIRRMPEGPKWPSPAVMKAICAAHRVQPKDAVLIGGNLAGEVGPALDLGMKAVYVRLGILDTAPPEKESMAAPNDRRPDGIVTRIQDLPKLPIFRPPEERGGSTLRIPRIDERGR
ncbi:HAD hydrolase-like protein [Telmatospirillum siberiense]|nr:HAD hydrolase-like protein [Telmatospirillum siberiense]